MRYNDDECLTALKESADTLGKSPTAKEYDNLENTSPANHKTIARRFGSWQEAKDLAGLDRLGQNRYDINESYFQELNPKSAYWLGFLYGDGSVGKQGKLALGLVDKGHIEAFLNDIGSNHPIRRREGNETDDSQPYYEVQINRPELIKHLEKHGMDGKKTFNGGLPNISDSLKPHFVRGLYDADGGWYEREADGGEIIITGQHNRLLKIADWIPAEVTVTKDKDSIRAFSTRKELAEWMFPDGRSTEPTLKRKIPDYL